MADDCNYVFDEDDDDDDAACQITRSLSSCDRDGFVLCGCH